MSIKTNAQLKTQNSSLIIENENEEITATILGNHLGDIIDSMSNISAVTNLTNLGDVSVASPSYNDILYYSGGTWKAKQFVNISGSTYTGQTYQYTQAIPYVTDSTNVATSLSLKWFQTDKIQVIGEAGRLAIGMDYDNALVGDTANHTLIIKGDTELTGDTRLSLFTTAKNKSSQINFYGTGYTNPDYRGSITADESLFTIDTDEVMWLSIGGQSVVQLNGAGVLTTLPLTTYKTFSLSAIDGFGATILSIHNDSHVGETWYMPLTAATTSGQNLVIESINGSNIQLKWDKSYVGINTPTIGQYASERYNVSAANSAHTFDWNNGNVQSLTLVSGNNTIEFLNPIDGGRYMLYLHQPASGSTSVVTVWPANIKWVDGTPPTLTATNSKIDIIAISYDGTNFYGTTALNF